MKEYECEKNSYWIELLNKNREEFELAKDLLISYVGDAYKGKDALDNMTQEERTRSRKD